MATLDGPRVKLARAQEHLSTLESEVRAFLDGQPYRLVGEFDREASEYVVRLDGPANLPIGWSAIVGDAAHNFRSALDHLIWQLVLLNRDEPGRWNQFPIFRDPDEYRTRGRRMLKSVSREHRERIEGMQPYARGDDAEADPLWALYLISNRDKHRMLHTAIAIFAGGAFRLIANDDVGGLGDIHWTFGALKGGREFARISILEAGSHPKVKVEGQVPFGIAFGDASDANERVLVDENVLGVLALEIAPRVRQIVESFAEDFS